MSIDAGPLAGLTLEAAEANLYGRSFRRYIPNSWHTVEPATEFVPGWHADAVAEHLQAVSKGQIRFLIISMAPRSIKSLAACVLWPTWDWIDHPHRRFIFGAFKEGLSLRDAGRSRKVLTSPWYQSRWGCRCFATPHADWCEGWRFSGDQNAKGLYENDRGGRRLTASVSAGTTGEGGDILVMDDPIDIEAAQSEVSRQSANDYIEQTWFGRMNDPKTGAMVFIAQRTHTDDPTGTLLRKMQYPWVHLCIPTEYKVPPMVDMTAIGWKDPRKVPGELMHPQRFGRVEVDRAKMNPFTYACQHDQDPTPVGGGIIKRHWFRFWVPKGWDLGPVIDPKDGGQRVCVPLPPEHEWNETIQIWDLNKQREVVAIKKGQDPDPVGGGVFTRRGGEVFLQERVNALLGIVETIESIAAVCQRWPQAVKKYIEYAANGPAVIALMRRKVGGFIPVTPSGSKVARLVTTAGYTEQASGGRAVAASEIIQSGSFYIPHPMLPWCVCGAPDWKAHKCDAPRRAAPWVWQYIDTFAAFPNVAHDEDVDVAAYGIMKLQPWVWRDADRQQAAAVEQGSSVPAATVAEVHRNRLHAALDGERKTENLSPYARR